MYHIYSENVLDGFTLHNVKVLLVVRAKYVKEEIQIYNQRIVAVLLNNYFKSDFLTV